MRLDKTSGPAPVRWLVNAYVEVIRSTPLLVQLFFFFALPSFVLRWTTHTAAPFAVVVNLGAYATGIICAGIASIPGGQVEAGLARNLKHDAVFRFVILSRRPRPSAPRTPAR